MKKSAAKATLAIESLSKYFLLCAVFLSVGALMYLMAPFFPAVMIAAIIATVFYPLHKRLASKIRFGSIASILSIIFVLFIILAPLSWFLFHIADQALGIYKAIEPKVTPLLDVNILPTKLQNTEIGVFIEKIQSILPVSTADVVGFASKVLQYASQFIVNQTTVLAKSISVFAVHIIVFILSLFFFFKDGKLIVASLGRYVPLPAIYRSEMMEKLKDMSRGIMLGVFGASILQGFVGGIGMSLAGLENVAFFATMMAFSSMVPYIGAFMIWGPASFYLMVTGEVGNGVFLFGWGVVVVSMIDNFVKPYIIGGSANVNPLLSFLAILGGMFSMGLPGIIVAPYILCLALSLLHIYEKEYAKVLD